MKQSPQLAFQSTAFAVVPGEDDRTNPGTFGKSLATWLSQQLRLKGLATGEAIAEDFGWCVPLESTPHKLYVACAGVDEEPNNWRVFVFAEGGFVSRLLGKDTSAESISTVFVAVRELLRSSPQVRGLREETT